MLTYYILYPYIDGHQRKLYHIFTILVDCSVRCDRTKTFAAMTNQLKYVNVITVDMNIN